MDLMGGDQWEVQSFTDLTEIGNSEILYLHLTPSAVGIKSPVSKIWFDLMIFILVKA